jgi:hypothetical protein
LKALFDPHPFLPPMTHLMMNGNMNYMNDNMNNMNAWRHE